MGYTVQQLKKLHPRIDTVLNFAKFCKCTRVICHFEFQGNVLQKELTYHKFRNLIRKLLRFARQELEEMGDEIKEQLKQQILEQIYTGQVLLSFPHSNPKFSSYSIRILGVNIHSFVIEESETYEEKIANLKQLQAEASSRYRNKIALAKGIMRHDLRRIKKQARLEKKRRVKEALEVLINEKGLNFIYDD